MAKKKKRKTPLRKLTAAVGALVLIVLLLFSAALPVSRYLSQKALSDALYRSYQSALNSEENLSITDNVINSADTDRRVLNIYYADCSNASVSEAMNSKMDSLAEELIGSYSKDTAVTVTLVGESDKGDEYYGLTVLSMTESKTDISTYIFNSLGESLSAQEAFGENIETYINDYLSENIRSDTTLAELLSENYAEYITADCGNFSLIVPGENGSVDVYFKPGTITNDNKWARLNIPENVVSGEYYGRRRVDPDKPMVAVTYDDGPNDTTYPQILDILEEYNVVATFFDIGCHVDTYPEMTRRAYDMGCEIGSHTYNHINLPSASQATLDSDKAAADAAFMNAIGEIPYLLRPPEGSIGGTAKYYYENAYIGWSVDTEDWLTRNAGATIYSVESFGNLDGQVILMHSIYDSTVTASAEIIPWLINQGYQLVTVSELLKYHYGLETIEPHLYYAVDFYLYGVPAV